MSPRARTGLIVAALAALAAAVVAGAAVLSADERDSGAATAVQPQPRKGFPPLALSLGVRDDAEARDLRRAVELYEAGRRKEAARIFGRFDSLEAKLGASFAVWPASEDRIEQLGALYPRSALVQLHVGLARFWAGTGGALSAWREARDVEPDTPYAVSAEDLIYAKEFAPGLPVFVPSFPYRIEGVSLAEQLEVLRADRTAHGRILYGVALQRLGRSVSARRAFAEAREAGAERRRRPRRRRGGPVRQEQPLGGVLAAGAADTPFPASGDGAFPPGRAAALAAQRAGGETAVALGSGESSRGAGSPAKPDGTSPS